MPCEMPEKPVVATNNGLFRRFAVAVQSQQNSRFNAGLYRTVVVLRRQVPGVRIPSGAPRAVLYGVLLRDGRMISIDCTGVEDALDVTMAQRSELDYLVYNDPLGYADLILNGDPKEYLKNVAGSHGLED